MRAPLVVKTEHHTFELTMTPDEVGALLGLSDQAVRDQCRQKVLPTMPRVALPGAVWRIPTCRLLSELGIPYSIEPATSSPTGQPDATSSPPTCDGSTSRSEGLAGGEVAAVAS